MKASYLISVVLLFLNTLTIPVLGQDDFLQAVPLLDSCRLARNNGRPFVPEKCSFPVKFSIPAQPEIPADTELMVTLTDSRKNQWRKYRFTPEFELTGNLRAMTRVIRVASVPSSLSTVGGALLGVLRSY